MRAAVVRAGYRELLSRRGMLPPELLQRHNAMARRGAPAAPAAYRYAASGAAAAAAADLSLAELQWTIEGVEGQIDRAKLRLAAGFDS